MSVSSGRVSLIGAGCGKADLITLRGAWLLQRCDALVYDDLIDPALLDLAPERAERYFMGKRRGHHSAPQEEICALLIRLAQKGRQVVRLKGGDPFVFGRGGEEALALHQAGILCEVVPGISSAIAIPAEAGIPVTYRGLSQSVHIITAHTADTPDGLPSNLDQLAKLPGTLVFLMGLSQLPRLLQRLVQAGMAQETPAAVISGGNAPHPMAIRGTLSDLAKKAASAGIQPPAVIVVGAVTGMNLTVTPVRPLSGIVIGVTGTDSFVQRLTGALYEQGADVFRAQRFQVEGLPITVRLDELLDCGSHWLVFTSANGVTRFFDALRAQQIDFRRLHACHFAVIGPATGAALQARGICPDLCPELHTTSALGKLLLERLPANASVVLLRSREGDPALSTLLRTRFSVLDCPLYGVRPDAAVASSASKRLETADYLVFASAGGVSQFFREQTGISEQTICVCIGEMTASALRQYWKGTVLIAETPSVATLVKVIQSNAASD